ncbi:hypothetical protein HDK64DRAFT_306567 [Phyllosticta capitalensis]
MGLSGFFFIMFRLAEIITLIPIIGMLSWFVHGYVEQNALTPDFILVLFIVSVLACAWAIATLVAYARARHSALFVATVDLGFLGALIAGVVLLRGIADQDCVNFSAGSFYFDLGVLGYYGRNSNSEWSLHANKTCSMLKASFAFGIMNCVFFFFTFLLALLVHRRYRDDRAVVVRRTHYTRRSHRPSREYQSSPRRSHHSSRARYYV